MALAVLLVVAAAAYAWTTGGAPADSHRRAGPAPATSTTIPASTATRPPTTTTVAPAWQAAWGSAMAWGYQTVSHATIRSLVELPVDGRAIRVRISNKFGNAPMAVGAASVGQAAGGAAVHSGTIAALQFAGSPSVTVPVGGEVVSDPLPLEVQPGTVLSVSVFVDNSELVTAHYPCCERGTPSYIGVAGSGDLTSQASPALLSAGAPFSRLVDAVYLQRPPTAPGTSTAPGSIVVVGDSITDGFNSTTRWTDVLQQRLAALPPDAQPAIVNEGNTANTLTAITPSDATTGGGPPGLQRLPTDALTLPGVSTVVLFLGTNDVFFGGSAATVIAGMKQAIDAVHAAGLHIVGVTLLPRAGDAGWTASRQEALQQVNSWMATTHRFDAVIAMASVVDDMYNGGCQPTVFLPAFDSGDHVHPNAAGATAMANAVDPHLFGLPSVPAAPGGIVTAHTAGCTGAPGFPPPSA